MTLNGLHVLLDDGKNWRRHRCRRSKRSEGVKLIVKTDQRENKEVRVMGVVFLIVIIVIAVWVLASCVRIVPQAYAVILETSGSLSGNLEYRNSLQGSVY